MAEYLVIRLSAETEQVSWLAVDDRGTRRGAPGSGSLQEARAQVRDRSVIVLVPGSEVLTLSANVPAKGAKLLAALPYALEDQVADDIENLHFAAGAKQADGSVPAAVVTHAALGEWLSALNEAGITPTRLVAENHGLAKVPNTLSLLATDNQIMFNDGASTEFVLVDISPSEALASTGIIDGEEDARHLVVYCESHLNDQFEKDWALLRHELASVDVNLLPDGALPRLAVTVASGSGINLLQGRYGKQTEMSSLLRPWRYAAMFLLALGLLAFVGKGADVWQLSAERDALKAQFTEEYRQLRPNDTREILDPRGTVGTIPGGNTAAAGPQLFLPTIGQLAASVQEVDGVTIEAISYRAGVVDIRLTAPDVPTLDNVVQRVAESGRFSASIQSADQAGEQVNSRIQIREAGA